MKKKITDNLLMRILALVVAIIIWGVVVNVSDPIIESTYSNVPVEIINSDTAAFQNKTYQVLDDTDSVTVTISAKRSINDLLTKDNIRATADLADLNEENGTIRIRLETNKYNDKIESIRGKNDRVSVEIEALMKKQLPIVASISGEPEEGYVMGDVNLDQNVVTVQGPESIVSNIDKALVEASIAGMANSISTTSFIRFYDKNGNIIDSSRLQCNVNSISLKVDVLVKKEMGFRFNTTGTLQEGYALADEIKADVDSVNVAGKQSAVSAVSVITIPATAIDIEGKNATFEVALDINKFLPENVVLCDEDFDGKITVTDPIEKLEVRSVEIMRENIVIEDYNETKCTISTVESSINIDITGLSSVLSEVNASDISGVISVADYMEEKGLSELKDGIYAFPVKLSIPNGVSLVEKIVYIQCRVKNLK